LPGRLRDSLQVFVKAVPQIETVDRADDVSSALKVVAGRHPSLVLLETSGYDNRIQTMVRQIRTEWPQAQCVVLANDIRQQQAALDAGADGVLLQGAPAAKLFAIIEKLLE
ncbi:MAG: hypothetical protein V3S14_09575, partial [Anaerolineae bacterium]